MVTKEDITVGILAGGKATRMNNKDKGLVLVNKKPLIEKILETVSENTSKIIINANRNLSTYKNYNYPVISDSLDNFQGPLSGIYSMLKSIDTYYLITLPCDCPNFSWYVIQKMIDHSNEENDVCVAHNGIRSQPVFMLVSKSKVQSLHNYLANGDRKIDIWYKQNNHKYIYFDNDTQYFDNINTTEQLNEYNSK
jgi:molybdenum cofactor guanylyltransferase